MSAVSIYGYVWIGFAMIALIMTLLPPAIRRAKIRKAEKWLGRSIKIGLYVAGHAERTEAAVHKALARYPIELHELHPDIAYALATEPAALWYDGIALNKVLDLIVVASIHLKKGAIGQPKLVCQLRAFLRNGFELKPLYLDAKYLGLKFPEDEFGPPIANHIIDGLYRWLDRPAPDPNLFYDPRTTPDQLLEE